MKILIKNGIVIDGAGEKRFVADVAIRGENIEAVGAIEPQDGDRVIDAKDRIVCPGFIDTHSHSDLEILLDSYVEPKVRQGVTTEILGQDGISMAPLPLEYVSAWRKSLAGLDGDSDQLNWDWKTTEGYLNCLDQRGVGPNVGYLVPHGNVRMEAMGLDNRKTTIAEIRKMQAIVRRELEAGALGLSTGLIYPPCAYADTQEIIELCKVVAEYDKVFVVHQRSEADAILESMNELICIVRESGVKIHISHFKLCGKKNWDKLEALEGLLEQAKAQGLRISYDQYPYIAGSTMLGVILPPWVHDGGTNKLLARLNDPGLRRKMAHDIENGIPGWDNFIDFAGWDGIYVTSVKTVKNQDCIGKNLVQIGEMRRKNIYDAIFDLLYEEENAVGMYDYYGTEEHVVRFMKRAEQNVCTDGLLAGKPHPRVYGTFPRVLGKYVRESQVISLEEAIQKMTGKAATVFNLKDRGMLQEGKKADLVIFDPKTIIDQATFVEPRQYPKGIEMVMINGTVVVEQGKRAQAITGKVIRN